MSCLNIPFICPVSLGSSGWAAQKNRGRGIVIDGVRHPLSSLATVSPHSISSRVQQLNQEALAQCIAEASFNTYTSAWNSWHRCASFYNFDMMCIDTSGCPLSVESCIRLLELYVGLECGLRQLNPASIKCTYLSGIAKVFDIRRAVNNFREAANHNLTQCLLDGYIRRWSIKHPAHQRAKIPFTMVLALQAESFLRSGGIVISKFSTGGASHRSFMETCRLTCALLFGIFFLLRKGEFLPKVERSNGQQLSMRRSHLRFMTEDQREIPYPLVGTVRAHWLTITIEFSKADQSGRGRIVTHFIDVANPTQCIVQRMEAYYMMSRDSFCASATDILFDIPGFPLVTTATITNLMRSTCHLLGLPSDKVSAHSLRYGGATTLAAAGFPEYVIAFYGGWAPGSRAMRTYIKPSNDIVKKVSLHMTRAQSSMAVQSAVNQILACQIPKATMSASRHA